ncbi:MAG: ATP-binding cassette domain-containing protein, partial [Pseudolabrys sp.]
MLLEAHAVSKSFGDFFAVRDANLSVGEGEIVGLIGPNGAGKSTFFNCLA